MMSTATDHGIELAARAIIDLINSRPISPRRDEIVAIIEEIAVEKTAPLPNCAPSPDRDGLDQYGPDITKYTP